MTLVPGGEDLTVIDESVDGWVGVSVEEGDGYVSADYVELSTEYTYAESRAEEKARLKKEEEERKAAEEAARQEEERQQAAAHLQEWEEDFHSGRQGTTEGNTQR